jgi:hypothetical protein
MVYLYGVSTLKVFKKGKKGDFRFRLGNTFFYIDASFVLAPNDLYFPLYGCNIIKDENIFRVEPNTSKTNALFLVSQTRKDIVTDFRLPAYLDVLFMDYVEQRKKYYLLIETAEAVFEDGFAVLREGDYDLL